MAQTLLRLCVCRTLVQADCKYVFKCCAVLCTDFNIFDMDQSVWNATVDALVDKSRAVNGKQTSLLEVGYEWVGQDDGW